MSKSPSLPKDLPAAHAAALVAASSGAEPLYRVEVELDRQSISAYGELRPLRTGMAIDADVMHERRAIWEWLLEPLLAASAKAQVR